MSRYFICTLSCATHPAQPTLLPGVQYIKGQKEVGESGFEHWQFVVVTEKKSQITGVARRYVGSHVEVTRSQAAMSYVWKEDTRVPDTQFEAGSVPTGRQGKDWAAIKLAARENRLDDIEPSVYVQCYSSLKRIAVDNMRCEPMEREVVCYWGTTGVGKSHRAWEEAGWDAYPKGPTTKFWDGYRGQQHVVIDEFRGSIAVEHVLRWCDKYPCEVEIKGSAYALMAKKIWFTSNLHPRDWWPGIDEITLNAILRKITVIEIRRINDVDVS